MAAGRAIPGVCKFVFSKDLNLLLRCRVDRVLPQALADELIGDEPLDLEVDLVFDGEVFKTAQCSQAVFEPPAEEPGAFRAQHLVFAAKLRDLPRQSSLVVRLRSSGGSGDGPRSYRGVLPLFNGRAVLRQGRQYVALLRTDDDGSTSLEQLGERQAPADWWRDSSETLLRSAPAAAREALRLALAADLCQRGCLAPAAPGFTGSEEHFSQVSQDGLEASGAPWVCLHLPVFQHPVVFAEERYDQDLEIPPGILAAAAALPSPAAGADDGRGAAAALTPAAWLLRPLGPPLAEAGAERPGDVSTGAREFKCFVDHAGSLAAREHPAIVKSHRLAGRLSKSSRAKDRDARPNADELRRLGELIRQPRRRFTAEERDLLLRFRWSLTEQPGALTKFLHAIDWNELEERQQAIELMQNWSAIGIDDALEMLSKEFRGIREVRRHAVERLQRASDEDLQLYLLQLVQAIRYEPTVIDSSLEDDVALLGAAEQGAGTSPGGSTPEPASAPPQAASMTLARFLISRAVRCRTLATRFYWYLAVETDSREGTTLFDTVQRQFMEELQETSEGQAIREMLERQVALRRRLLWCLDRAKAVKRERIEKKIERFRHALVSDMPPDPRHPHAKPLSLVGGLGEGIPLPADPAISLMRVLPEQSFLLKSSQVPAVLECEVRRTADPPSAPLQRKKIIMKEGDDLRQDQLVLQLCTLMDSILKKYGLDLQFSPYQVAALSKSDGFVEFLQAQNVSAVLKDYNGDMQQFFRAHYPQVSDSGGGGYGPHNSYGIKPEVLENFVRSSAGYCVITYLLGIGDRHLDNLMVTPDGHLFHIDFGFILGRDPKVFAAPMRMSKEMVEAMGGSNSPNYQSFRSKCCQAYKILRRHAKLITNLLYLMTDSGIRDLTGDPQFAILKVEQKFQANMDDEQAEEHFLSLIDESVSALIPDLLEQLHKVAMIIK